MLMPTERGLVISPPTRVSGEAISIVDTNLDPQDLRASLLFWDKLDCPTNNFMYIDPGPEAAFLMEAGILQRTHTALTPYGSAASYLRAAHVGVFRQLDKEQPGTWSVSRGVNSITFTGEELEVERGVLVQLVGAVPVPDKEVPLEDILNFRARRRDELVALRFHLERIYQQVIAAQDGALALNTEIGALQTAISDHIRVSQEARFRLRIMDLSASLNLVPVGIWGLAAVTLELPIISSLLGGVAAGLAVNISAGLKGRQAQATPFQYVTSYRHDLF